MDKVAIFDGPYSEEKITEGLAVMEAMLSGACNTCQYLAQCENGETMKFPADAPCMRK